ncbi:hypothetical protein Vadar_003055 [Vaccinium darrowii]|uniref:Uncharacterized protein n=1 Tax=Vaccinium darrowii TaxID=229202 RepID=A0ACB7XFD9_9ERIC|nr:hypothetical protein Vadar_003055 [Vaccinium darrowii]
MGIGAYGLGEVGAPSSVLGVGGAPSSVVGGAGGDKVVATTTVGGRVSLGVSYSIHQIFHLEYKGLGKKRLGKKILIDGNLGFCSPPKECARGIISNQPKKMHEMQETEIDILNQPKKMHETEIDISKQPKIMHETEIDVSNLSNPSLSTPPSQTLPSPQEIDVADNMNEQSPQVAAAARASSPGVALVRTIYCNDRDSNLNHGYFKVPNLSFTGNSIRTTKYGVVTFLPKCLFEQVSYKLPPLFL